MKNLWSLDWYNILSTDFYRYKVYYVMTIILYFGMKNMERYILQSFEFIYYVWFS